MNTNTNKQNQNNTNEQSTNNYQNQNPELVCSGLLIRSEHANGKAAEPATANAKAPAKANAKGKTKRGKASGNVLFGDLRRVGNLPEPPPMTPDERKLAELSHEQGASTLSAPGGEGKGEVARSIRPFVNFAEREFNRKLSLDQVLERLRRWMPAQFDLAEVVGKWIWISFPEAPIERVRADLAQLGFHWNNTRKCWQHPCGETMPRGQDEPREKYTSFFPAQAKSQPAAATA